jgi:thiol-disulfide isomerase/thioredoxin
MTLLLNRVFFKALAILGLSLVLGMSSLASERYDTPPLSLERLSQHSAGELVSLKDYKDKVVLLNFWATWCPPCVHELPSMQSLHDALNGQPFEILALNMGEDPAMVGKFLDSFNTKLTFPILLHADRKVAIDWSVRAMPTSMLVDKKGKLVSVITGARMWDSEEMVNAIMPLLEE